MILLALLAASGMSALGSTDPSTADGGAESTLTPLPANPTLSFEANLGQWDAEALYHVHADGYDAFLTPTKLAFVYTQASQDLDANATPPEFTNHSAVFMHFDRALTPLILPGAPLQEVSNYFLGNDPTAWITNVPHFDSVAYQNLYPLTDLVYHAGVNGELEYDFVLKPGASPDAIQLHFEGLDGLSIAEDGRLVLETSVGTAYHAAPSTYQLVSGIRQSVASHYVLVDSMTVGFAVENYDQNAELVIDPLVYSTYLGGSSQDQALANAVDASGNHYVAGLTASTTYPTTAGSFQTINTGGTTGFVTKIAPDGASLVYSTYVGGASNDAFQGLALDSAGNVYVAGYSTSSNYPTTAGAYDTTCGCADAVVTKLNPSGNALVYSTYLGGSSGDGAYAIAIDAAGSAYVTGYTASTNFPTTAGALDTTLSTINDGFVAKLAPDGASLGYSTYLGSTGTEELLAIAVDSAGSAYVTGYTTSTTLATTGAYDTTQNTATDALVAKLNPAGSALVYATYLGGNGNDYGRAITVDEAGQAYIAGESGSTNYPVTAGAAQTTKPGATDAFLSVVSANGDALTYSTYLGGNGADIARGMARNDRGVYVVGETQSTNFPVTAGAYQTTKGSTQDAFLVQYTPAFALGYASLLGGISGDTARAVSLGASTGAYVVGNSINGFPTTGGAFQTTWMGGDDAFAVKFGAPTNPQGLTAACASPHGTTLTWTAPANLGAGPVSYNVYRHALYGTNVLANGDLSAWPTSPGAPTGFLVAGGGTPQTWTRETIKTHSNPNAAKVSVSGNVNLGGVWIGQDFVPSQSGSYQIEAWETTDGSGYPRLRVTDVSAGGVALASVPGTQNGLVWERLQTTLSLTAGTTYNVRVINHVASSAGDAFYADDFHVRLLQDSSVDLLAGTTSATSFSDAPAYDADGYTDTATAVNAFGASTPVSVNHVPCDSQAPSASGNPVNAGWVSATSTITGVSWQDSYSGLASGEYSLGTTSGATDIQAWTRMPAQPVAGTTASWNPVWTPSGMASGTNYVNVRATDQSGNQVTTSGAYVLQFDPAAPTISGNPQNLGWRNAIPTFTGVSWTDATSGLSSAEYSIGLTSGATNVQGWTALSVSPGDTNPWTPSITPPGLGQGMNYVNVRVTDIAGNILTTNGAYTVQYDAVLPGVIGTVPQPYAWTNAIPTVGTLSWQDTGSGLANNAEYSVGSAYGSINVVGWTTLAAGQQPGNGQTNPWTPGFTPVSLAQGRNYVNVNARDVADNLRNSMGAYTIDYDNVAATIAGAPSNLGWHNTMTLSGVSWTDSTSGLAASVTYSIGTTSGGVDVVASGTTAPVQPTAGQTTSWAPSWTPSLLVQGSNYVNMRVTDRAGNLLATNGAYRLDYDTALPTATGYPVSTPWQAATTAISGVTYQDLLSGLAASAQYSIGRSAGATDIATWANMPAQPTAGTTATWNPSWTPAGLQPGTNYVNIRVTDRAGNQFTINGAYQVHVDVDAPTVTGSPQDLGWLNVNPTASRGFLDGHRQRPCRGQRTVQHRHHEWRHQRPGLERDARPARKRSDVSVDSQLEC